MTRRRVSPPAGAAAYLLEEATRRREAEERIVAGLRAAGFREAMVPAADYLAPYAPHLDAREERELYRFVDRHGDTLALRADFTIALARHLAPRISAAAARIEPVRVFYRGDVLRGGTRDGVSAEFFQIGAEILGDDGEGGADADAALCCLDALEAGGVRKPWFVLSSVGAVEQLLAPELSGAAARTLAAAIRERRIADAARAAEAVSAELALRARRLLEGDLPAADPLVARLGAAGERLARVASRLAASGRCTVAIDLADPAPRSYYTGLFFSVYGAAGGEPIAGGGRYDGLYGAFGAAVAAVGFSLGLEGVLAG